MKEELLNELKDAMRTKDELKKNTITMLRASILQNEKDNQKILTDEEIQVIVSKEVKKRSESINDYIKGDRQDIVDQLNKEIEILNKYLPKQLTIEELEVLVKESASNVGATSSKDMGKVMQDLKSKVSGKADGKLVSEIVRNLLSKM
jgi:uncharacterized protein YqeY